ncbi:MAG: ABC transporter substrate-binding protein [Deltaproteobacteria bacterium]|nr:ABC transporter substrate-binding protein [Deltaproteobacteria bacterium]
MSVANRARNTGPAGRLGLGIWTVLMAALVSVLCEISLPAAFAESADDAITLGVLYPITGPDAERGTEAWKGAQLAAMDVNLSGGILGAPVRLALGDTQSDPQIALQEARRLQSFENIECLIGVLDGECAASVSRFAELQGLVFLGSGHEEGRLLLEEFRPVYFHLTPSTHQTATLAGLYAATLPWEQYAVCGPDTESSRTAATAFIEALASEKKGAVLRAQWWTRPNDPDFTEIIETLRKDHFPIALCLYRDRNLAEFFRQSRLLGLFPNTRLICPFGGGDYLFLKEMGDRIPDGFLMGAHHHLNWPDTQANVRYVYRFKGRFGHFPSESAIDGYVAVRFAAQGFNEAGSLQNLDKLIKTMESLKLSLPWDTPGFQSHMHSESHQLVLPLAMGKTTSGSEFPPAVKMIKEWFSVSPSRLMIAPWDIFEGRYPKKE